MKTALTFSLCGLLFAPAALAGNDDPAAPQVEAETVKPASDLATIVQGLQNRYESADDYSADFVQETVHPRFPGRTREARGTVTFKKPGMMRWEYKQPREYLLVGDGQRVVLWEPDKNLATVGAVESHLASAFLAGLGNLRQDFRIELVEEPPAALQGPGHVLRLQPKQGAAIQSILLQIDPQTWEVQAAMVIDAFDRPTTTRFTDARFDIGVDASFFDFAIPEDAEVLDPRGLFGDHTAPAEEVSP